MGKCSINVFHRLPIAEPSQQTDEEIKDTLSLEITSEENIGFKVVIVVRRPVPGAGKPVRVVYMKARQV
jgi:hypothetical protein